MTSVAEVAPMTTSQPSNPSSENLGPPTLPAHSDEAEDVTSGAENASDNDGIHAYNASTGEELQEVVSFSIGRGQNYMKSARTPAAEKSQAIEHSAESYFDIETSAGPGYGGQEQDISSNMDTEPPRQVIPSGQQLPDQGPQKTQPLESLSSPWRPGQALQQRSAATRAFLADGFTNLRRRASSGPSSLTDNVRRLLSDLPSLSMPKNTNFGSFNFGNLLKEDTLGPQNIRHKRSNTLVARDHVSPIPSRQGDKSPAGPPSIDGNISNTSLNANKPNGLLRRSTSDNSLYLTRGLSQVSTLDDTTKWDVSEQVNSRFKAITDSFQDSRIRRPKVPSINFPSFRPTAGARTESETARETAAANAQNTRLARSPEPSLTPNGSLTTKVMQAKPNVVSAEQRAHPVIAKALEALTGDVIVIGGYRGSILRSAKPPHRQLWVPVKVGLNLRKVNLEVGLSPEDEEKMEETIFASGVLSHIGPVDICRRLLRHLRKCPNTKSNRLRVHDYGYDWRLSPHFSSRKFLDFVEKLKCNQPDVPAQHRGVTVIAHSLGGLIARHAVNVRPELFAGVIYAGVPQRCVNILGPLRNGDSVLLSSRVLTAQVNFTMRTSFVLLPEDGKCFINKQTGERYDVDFFDVKTWEEYRLSPCIRPPLPPSLQEYRKSLIGALSESLPSLPVSSKRSSWTFGRDASPDRDRDTVAHKARNAASETADTAANGALEVTNPEGSSPTLEPSMNQSYSRGSTATACTIPRDEAIAYLSRTLAEVRAFKEELTFRAEHEINNVYPPLAYIYAKSVPTVYGARVASREAIKYTDAYDDLAFAAGDGVVLASAAMLPRGYRCVRNGRVEVDRGHVGLLGDIEGVGEALQAIIEAREKGVGLGRKYARPNNVSAQVTADSIDGLIDA
jgi:pimeloyl-ACP methyl ester carboxylesterase